MEVGVQAHRVGNMSKNNGHVGPRANHKLGHAHSKSKSTSASPSAGEFHSTTSQFNHDENSGKPSRSSDKEEIRQQTLKVMDAFLKKSIVAKGGVAEKIRMGSREKFTKQKNVVENRSPSPSGRTNQPKITTAPLRNNDFTQLYNVMRRRTPISPTRHRSDASLASSDSADGGLSDGRFQRTKSFTRAQRHSILTELENRVQHKSKTRRSSEDVPQIPPMHRDGSLLEYSGENGTEVESPISHTRASSDSLLTKYDTTGKHKPQNKDKEKKGWFSKRFKKKKDAHKDSATAGDGVTATSHANKVSKHHGDRRTVNREDSTASKRRSPSPPGSPKRTTPKLIRRLSSRIKKIQVGKSDSFNSLSKSSVGSKNFDIVEEEDGLQRTNGEVKSNSLPSEVRLSTKPVQSSHKKHKDVRKHVSAVAVDGVLEHSNKSSRKNHRDSFEMQRPTTLDIPKKKSGWKKLKKIFVDSSSSSSDTSSSLSSQEELRKGPHDVLEKSEREGQVLRRSQHSGSKKERNGVKYSNSDQQRPTSEEVRGQYQHRPTKSMNDMDPRNKNLCDEIAMKLRKVLEEYNHLITLQNAGSAGHTQTSDLHKQYLQKGINREKASSATPVKESSLANEVCSHAMKAYFNMSEASKSRPGGESGDQRQARRITRDQISHRPSGSFDSPHRSAESSHRWPERVENERRTPRSTMHVVVERHQRTESPLPRLTDSATASPPRLSQVSAELRSLPPPPISSTSPILRASRTRHRHSGPSLVESDAMPTSLGHSSSHLVRHIDYAVTASSPRGVRHFEEHTDIVADTVETDALPFGLGQNFSSTDVDMVAFADDEDVDITERVEETVVTEDIFSVPANAAAPDVGQRTTTALRPPNGPNYESELDNDDEDESALGAVGGVDPRKEDVNVDKLVEKLVELLCKKGDEINTELDTPQIEENLGRAISRLSQKELQNVVKNAVDKMWQKVSIVSHPEIIQLAMIFNMASMFFGFVTNSSAISNTLNSYIERILKKFGGWSSSLVSSIDATTEEICNLEKETPGTSGLDTCEKRRKSSDSSDKEVE